jgi:molybdenum cofactor biosynthesis enzyme MoaA
MEWSNKYNSFNSYKGLAYYDNYKSIINWMRGKSDTLPPPIEVNLDPYAECNLSCYFCIVQRYLKTNRAEVGEMRSLPGDYMRRLVDYLADWGVRGLCISGGGEPTLHKDLSFILAHAADKKLDTALVTNMVKVSRPIMDASMACRWIAMSIDAGKPESYAKIKGRDCFYQVLKNVKQMVKLRSEYNSKIDLAYKMVVLPENVDEIYDACKIAQHIGVQDFHIRPVDLERSDIEGHRKLQFNMVKVYEQFQKCHELENDNFHVYTVTHKFDGQFHNKQDFKQCLMTPILLPILTDGNAYLCVDKKMQAKYKIGSCYPNPEQIGDWWGSDAHRKLIRSVLPSRDCADNRCTGQCYNEQIEKVVLHDGMCLSFP